MNGKCLSSTWSDHEESTVECCVCLGVCIITLWVADLPKPLVTGMTNPESVCLGSDGRMYVTEIGEFGKDGDGQVSVIVDGKAKPFATGLDERPRFSPGQRFQSKSRQTFGHGRVF